VKVALIVPDLMDRSRITAALPDAEFGNAESADVVIIDLARALDQVAVTRASAAHTRIVCFGPHVDDAAADTARAAGADVVINYRTENVVERIRAETGGVDRIVDVDFGKNLPLTSRVLRPDGVIASYASMGNLAPEFPYREMFQLNPTIRPVFVYTMPDAAKAHAHADIARWLAEAKPVFAIAERYPLAEVVQAHLAVERGEKIGHVMLAID
jgi:NADPH:quinone reductase-like Zn-dependent oxidoreductase